MAASRHGIAPESIYEALLDDQSFGLLPQHLASAYDARSCLIHWMARDGTDDVLAHSGYFSDEQLTTYAAHFASQDPWIEASARGQRPNEAMNLEELVPVPSFTRTPFYNDYVRAMGDDTCRCVGLRIENEWGSGFLALQRGRSQSTFHSEAVSALQAIAPHVRRMLSVRGRLAVLERRQSSSETMLDALGDAAILVTGSATVIHFNAAAADLIGTSSGITLHGSRLQALTLAADRQLKSAVAQAAAQSAAEAGALRVPCRDGRELVLTVAPLRFNDRPCVLILVNDPQRLDATIEARLRDLYRLSPVEARLAVLLANGESPDTIAELRGVAVGTVRSQIKAVALKLDCRRQTEIVALVKALPALRSPASGLAPRS